MGYVDAHPPRHAKGRFSGITSEYEKRSHANLCQLTCLMQARFVILYRRRISLRIAIDINRTLHSIFILVRLLCKHVNKLQCSYELLMFPFFLIEIYIE